MAKKMLQTPNGIPKAFGSKKAVGTVALPKPAKKGK